jgi:hypothetical protein
MYSGGTNLPDTVWTICCLHTASYRQVKSTQYTNCNQNTPTENTDTPTGQLVYLIFNMMENVLI